MSGKTPEAVSLPARYYVDSDYYRTELEWFFFGMWFHAGRADEVPRPGDFVVREIAGESLIIVRDDHGELNAFYNVCRHRGTRLTEQSAGKFASTIVCPYHAWRYGLGGDLISAPRMDDVADFRLEDYPLQRVAIAVWDGLVFLNMSDESCPLAQQLDGSEEQFRPWRMDQLRLGKRVAYDVAANWKLIVHNYSECLHCPGVHPALQKLSHYLSGENEPTRPNFLGGRMRLRDGIGTMSFDGVLCRACLPDLRAEECRYVYFYAILPNLLLSCHPDYVMTHMLLPRGVGRTEIVCDWLFHPDAMAESSFDPDDAFAFWDLTNRQDWHVCEQMQLGLTSRAYRPGPYSHREALLHGFDRLILERERKASRSPR